MININTFYGVEPTSEVRKLMLEGMNHHQRGITHHIVDIADQIGGKVRISKKGTPHIVMTGKCIYSLAFFAKDQIWKVFWPYGVDSQKQKIRTFKEIDLLKILTR